MRLGSFAYNAERDADWVDFCLVGSAMLGIYIGTGWYVGLFVCIWSLIGVCYAIKTLALLAKFGGGD